ncbi:MAG TPA: TolC family protein [Bryobacteraceae bacterium]|nr:TolC family protein [Bryobacteraceae bacterium]
MSKAFGVSIVLLVSWGPQACRAQSQLSLQDAINEAIQTRASLKADAEQVNIAQGLRKQAGVIPNPEFQFQNENLRPGMAYTRDVDTLAMINQPLDILGKRKHRILAADEAVTRSRANYDLARWLLTQRVKLAYWAVRGQQEILDVLKKTAENFQDVIQFHAAQLSAGAIAEQDLLRVRLEGERLKISADLAFIDLNRARMALFKEMGRTDFSEVVLTEPLAPGAEIVPGGVEQALGQRMEIKAARAAVEQARANARLQEVNARPDLNITYGYKRTELPDTTYGVNTAIVSARITLPVTDKNQGNRVAAEAEVHRQQQLLAAEETGVRADYADALQEYEMRRTELVQALDPLRDHAAEIAKIAAAAYAEGATDLLRLLDAQRARLDAQLAWTRGMVDYRQSIVRLEAAEGVNP